jgi:hypothetical protein
MVQKVKREAEGIDTPRTSFIFKIIPDIRRPLESSHLPNLD